MPKSKNLVKLFVFVRRKCYLCGTILSAMEKNDTPKTREEVFAAKAKSYGVCYSDYCPLREHCLHSILVSYVPADRLYVNSVNLGNPEVQRESCPLFSKDESVRMPVGLSAIYYDMPGRIERAVKNHLISVFSRKRYYEYHNGTRPLPPEAEAYVRRTLQNYGWTEEPTFAGYVEDFLW